MGCELRVDRFGRIFAGSFEFVPPVEVDGPACLFTSERLGCCCGLSVVSETASEPDALSVFEVGRSGTPGGS